MSDDATVAYYERNPTFRWLVGTGGSRLARFFLILVPWYIAAYLVCWYDNCLVIDGPHVGLFADLVIVALLITLPAIVAATLRLLRHIESLLAVLPEVIARALGAGPSLERHERLRQESEWIRGRIGLRDRGGRLRHFVVLAVFAALVIVFQILIPIFLPQQRRAWALWPQRYPTAFVFASAWSAFYFVFVIGNAFWYAVATAFTVFPVIYRYAKQKRLVIIPVAPDGKGGLSPIGRVAFGLTLIAACGMPFVVGWMLVFGLDLPLLLGMSLYLVFLVLIFFGPLLSIHWAMKQAKEQELRRLALLFRKEYQKLPSLEQITMGLPHGGGQPLNTSMQMLSRIDQLYRRAEVMPVWPFSFDTLGKFLSLVLVPLLLALIQLATENAVSKLVGKLLK